MFAITPRKFNITPENWPSQKERIVFQLAFFRGELLNFGGVDTQKDMCSCISCVCCNHLQRRNISMQEKPLAKSAKNYQVWQLGTTQ